MLYFFQFMFFLLDFPLLMLLSRTSFGRVLVAVLVLATAGVFPVTVMVVQSQWVWWRPILQSWRFDLSLSLMPVLILLVKRSVRISARFA